MHTSMPWREAIASLKRQLLEQALASAGGDWTHATRALGLKRTYFLRLIRDMGITNSCQPTRPVTP